MEIGLRIAGYGYATEIALRQTIQGNPSYTNNNRFAWRFFPPTIARTADPFTFSVNKPDNTYRIFVLGASAAAGVPDGAFSFGRILEKMLAHQFPAAPFEVITLAMPAINSHVVCEIAKDCTHYQADLFVVYLGNNEVVGPFGAGTVFSPLHGNASLITLGMAAKETKLGQLFMAMMISSGVKKAPRVWQGLGMFLEKQVRHDAHMGGIQVGNQDKGHVAIGRHMGEKLFKSL